MELFLTSHLSSLSLNLSISQTGNSSRARHVMAISAELRQQPWMPGGILRQQV